MIRVGVIGAAGRMGATVCNAVHADPELDFVAAVAPQSPGAPLHR
ncbi:MAG: 4-hydroxy-tetrahydrodipicolinate reductase, partial [Ilumatobacteraceae bacterium]